MVRLLLLLLLWLFVMEWENLATRYKYAMKLLKIPKLAQETKKAKPLNIQPLVITKCGKMKNTT